MTLAVHLEDVLDGLLQPPVHHWDVALKKQLFFRDFFGTKIFCTTTMRKKSEYVNELDVWDTLPASPRPDLG